MPDFKKTVGFGVSAGGIRFDGNKVGFEAVEDVKVLGLTFLFALVPTALFGLAAAYLRTDPAFIRSMVIGLISVMALLAWRKILGREGLRLVRLRLKSGEARYGVMHRQEAEYMANIVKSYSQIFGEHDRLHSQHDG